MAELKDELDDAKAKIEELEREVESAWDHYGFMSENSQEFWLETVQLKERLERLENHDECGLDHSAASYHDLDDRAKKFEDALLYIAGLQPDANKAGGLASAIAKKALEVA